MLSNITLKLALEFGHKPLTLWFRDQRLQMSEIIVG